MIIMLAICAIYMGLAEILSHYLWCW